MKKLVALLSLSLFLSFQASSQIDTLLDAFSVRLTAHRLFIDEAQVYLDYEFGGNNALEFKGGMVYPNKAFVPFTQENLSSNWSNYEGYFAGVAYKHYYLFTHTKQLYWSVKAMYKFREVKDIDFITEAPYDPNYISSQDITTYNLKFEFGEDIGALEERFFFQVYGGFGVSYHMVNATYQKTSPVRESVVSQTWEDNKMPSLTTSIEFKDAGVFVSPSLHFGIRTGIRL